MLEARDHGPRFTISLSAAPKIFSYPQAGRLCATNRHRAYERIGNERKCVSVPSAHRRDGTVGIVDAIVYTRRCIEAAPAKEALLRSKRSRDRTVGGW